MARTTKPLSTLEVKNAKSKDKEYTLYDGGGLQLRIRPNGSKQWFFNYYRPYTKKRAVMSLGKYPALGLADARSKREEARALLVQDIDPQEHREEQEKLALGSLSTTLEFVAEQWFEVKKSEITEKHAIDVWRSINNHLFPDLGKLPVEKITPQKAIQALKPLAAKGSLESVKRSCQRLNEIMTFAVNTGLAEHNSLSGIHKAFRAPKKKHMPTIRPEELPRFMQALANASIKRTTRCLIEWQLHTMVRPAEAAGARWEEIDFDQKLWNIPAERMKKKRPHRVPLTARSLALLAVMKEISGKREHIFPADRDRSKHINSQTANTAIKRMGFQGQLVSHGLRALASTTLNEKGFDPDVIESALAHVGEDEVRNAYNRANYLPRRRKLMDWWSEHIERAAQGNMSLGHYNLSA